MTHDRCLARGPFELALSSLLFACSVLALVGCRSDFDGASENRPYQACEDCQVDQCNAASEACDADPDCVSCLSTPYAFECIANDAFRRLGSCSCSDCASQCSHMCPVAQGACEACGVTECNAEVVACTAEAECSTCLANLGGPGCEANALFMDFQACGCTNCGQQCLWACPNAVNECANCGFSACGDPYGACVQDPECADCFDNPSLRGCESNGPFIEANMCICGSCDPQCGILFGCG